MHWIVTSVRGRLEARTPFYARRPMVAPCDTKALARLAARTATVASKRVAELPWAARCATVIRDAANRISRPVHADFRTRTERDSSIFGISHARSWLTQSEIMCQQSQPTGELPAAPHCSLHPQDAQGSVLV
jgi:hypothetical protein